MKHIAQCLVLICILLLTESCEQPKMADDPIENAGQRDVDVVPAVEANMVPAMEEVEEMNPTIHTLLSRGFKDDGSANDPISLDEWREAVESMPRFTITDQLKQKNPFTQEFVLWDMPGSGHWASTTIEGPVWSEDDLVWFRYTEGTVTFIQFSNLEDPDLRKLAEKLNAQLEHHRIGS